jgi:hypothetical protein
MIPAYKVTLFTGFGASLYMMGRLVLVSYVNYLTPLIDANQTRRDTRLGSARTRFRSVQDIRMRPTWNHLQTASMYKQ